MICVLYTIEKVPMSEKITAANLDLVISRNQEIQQEIADCNYDLMINEECSWDIPSPQLGFLLLQKRGLVLFPIEDPYWSGGIFTKDGISIPVINTAQPRVNQYFTAWHELYHLLYDKVSFDHQVGSEITIEERKADNFAASMLLSGVQQYFSGLTEKNFVSKIFFCMSMFQSPYKAVLIALYEYGVEKTDEQLCSMIKLHFDDRFDDLPERFRRLGLDDNLVLPSYTININYLRERINEQRIERPDLRYNESNSQSLDRILEQTNLLLRK